MNPREYMDNEKLIKNLMKICRTIIIKLSGLPIDWTYKCCRFTPWGCGLDEKYLGNVIFYTHCFVDTSCTNCGS